MTKRQKVINEFCDSLWEMGNNRNVTFDEWNIIIGRLRMVLAKNFIEPIYQIQFDDKMSIHAKVEK